MPVERNSAATMSPMEAPTRTGGESGCPVRLMTPPIAWTMMSYAARDA